MRITIDTKEDSVQEIQHIIHLLQRILARDHHAPQAAQTGLQQGYAPMPSPSAYAAPPTTSSPIQSPPSVLSMFDAPKVSPPSSYSGPSATGIPGMSGTSSMAMQSAQDPPQNQPQTPSIFDIFESSQNTPTKGTTSQETANDLLNYDKEHDDEEDSSGPSYTFTTY